MLHKIFARAKLLFLREQPDKKKILLGTLLLVGFSYLTISIVVKTNSINCVVINTSIIHAKLSYISVLCNS